MLSAQVFYVEKLGMKGKAFKLVETEAPQYVIRLIPLRKSRRCFMQSTSKVKTFTLIS